MLSLILLVLQSVLIYRTFLKTGFASAAINPSEKKIIAHLEKARPVYHIKAESKIKMLVKPDKPLDPNKLEINDWMNYGLTESQARTVCNIKAKGKYFRSKEDLKSIKYIPAKVFANLEPWLVFDELKEEEVLRKNKNSDETTKKFLMVDINAADTVLLGELPLIGEGRARAIWRYREKLGGFYSTEQLKEIRSLPDSVLKVIVPHIAITTPVYRKIDVNAVSDSIRHPYFSYKLIKMIQNYRELHGPFTDSLQLAKLPLVDEDLWRKIAPYIFYSTSSQP